jgi:SAM-dependent methyltransferase
MTSPTGDVVESEASNNPWYYQIELEPGVFTSGKRRDNLAMVRDFLDRVSLTGARCLDIGTQEAISPVVLCRRGAESVTAYDRLSMTARIEAVKQAYKVRFDYVHGIPLWKLATALRDAGSSPVFDVIVFSGVLYHMIDPLAGLAHVRSMLRQGGILVLETSVSTRNNYAAEFNAEGRFYEGGTYFQVSIGVLDYWLRMLRLAPIDCARLNGGEVSRFVVVCRAMDAVEADPNDHWMRIQVLEEHFAWHGLHYAPLQSTAAPVPYTPIDPGVPRAGTNSIRLWQTSQKRGLHKVNPKRGILHLEDES